MRRWKRPLTGQTPNLECVVDGHLQRLGLYDPPPSDGPDPNVLLRQKYAETTFTVSVRIRTGTPFFLCGTAPTERDVNKKKKRLP